MKKILILLTAIIFTGTAFSQDLFQVAFTGGSNLSYFSILTDGEVLIRFTEDGKIKDWGIEIQSNRGGNYYAPSLQPYLGRIEYYGQEADSISRGKVKSIGSAQITYYESYETDYKIGKIRSIGSQLFDYYTNYDDKTLRGKLRFIGNTALEFYSSFEDRDIAGKLKSVGSTLITYYSSFDDRFIRGKIKSIGPSIYSWYTSVDQPGYGGGLKNGNFRQNVGSVTYIVQ